MFIGEEILNLIVWCLWYVQQLGITLAVGAESVLLLAYLAAMRDSTVDNSEERMAKVVRWVLNSGLVFIVLSGLGVSLLHFMAGEIDTLLAPAFLFKWALIALLLGFSTFAAHRFSLTVAEGFAGGTWFAIYIDHLLHPVTSWVDLFIFYAVWMGGFLLVWSMLVYMYRDKRAIKLATPVTVVKKPEPPKMQTPVPTPPQPPPVPKPAPAPLPPEIPKPVVPTPTPVPPTPTLPVKPPVITPAIIPQKAFSAIAPLKPVPGTGSGEQSVKQIVLTKEIDPDKNPDLPAIQVMPRTPQDVENQNRATLVKLE